MTNSFDTVHALTDGQLLTSTERLLAKDHALTAELLLHLGEIDARRLYLERAYPSMFAFCVGELGMSEDASYARITVARAARRFQGLLAYLSEGRVHLTGLRLLAPHLTAENWAAILEEAAGQSKQGIEKIVARLAPKPAVPATMRKLPERRWTELPLSPATLDTSRAVVVPPALVAMPAPPANPSATHEPSATAGASSAKPTTPADPSPVDPATPADPAPVRPAGPAPVRSAGPAPVDPAGPAPVDPALTAGPHRQVIRPLAEEAFRVQFTASRETRDKLREAQALLRHQVPDGDLAKIVALALDLLLADTKKKRFGVGKKVRPAPKKAEAEWSLRNQQPAVALQQPGAAPRQPSEAPPEQPSSSRRIETRHIPAAIRRAVFERDAGRCAFVDARGQRCPEHGGLELDHLDGYARTKRHSLDRIRLACRAHNRHAADQMYGREFMEKKLAQRSERGRNTEATRSGTSCQPSLL